MSGQIMAREKFTIIIADIVKSTEIGNFSYFLSVLINKPPFWKRNTSAPAFDFLGRELQIAINRSKLAKHDGQLAGDVAKMNLTINKAGRNQRNESK